MSTAYDIDIIANETFVLKANFSGIREGETNADSLAMSIYAYKSETWIPIFSHSLWIDDIRKLYWYLSWVSLIKDTSIETSWKFIEANDGINELIKELENIEPNIIRIIFDKFQEDSRITHILSVLTEIEAENLVAAHKYKKYRDELDNLIELLDIERSWNLVSEVETQPILIKYIAGQPEMIFQKWIEENLWIFWVEYIEQYPFRAIVPSTDPDGWSTADLVMQSMDGFLELIELKRAKYDIFKSDHSHHCYRPSKDLSVVLWQSLFYLQKLDEYKIYLETQNPDIQILRPRVKIILWRSDWFTAGEHKALRMLNSNLSHIEIITYDHLIKYWELLLSQYVDHE
jgi:hypothetical protein